MLNVALERNYKVTFSPKCQHSGWPIDLSISDSTKGDAKIGFIFLLKEDLCYNISTNSEEPLGMQKTNDSASKITLVTT
jgi:hypothetical protein